MKNLFWLVTLFFVSYCQAEIHIAADLLVDIDAKDLTELASGAAVSSWQNKGSLGGNFIPAGGPGATISVVNGRKAISFDGKADSVMTNTVKPSVGMLGSGDWSAEIWVYNAGGIVDPPEAYLAWTPRGGLKTADGADANGYTVAEFRFSADINNCVEHYNKNIPWGGKIAVPGHWHSIALTRTAEGVEKLFVDGQHRTTQCLPGLNLKDDGEITLGGIYARDNPKYLCNFFTGYLAKIRIHDGALTDRQVVENFRQDSKEFPFFWDVSTTEPANWNAPGNWSFSTLPTEESIPSIANGGTALITEDTAVEGIHLIHGGLTITNGATLNVLGSGENFYPGNSGSFTLKIPHGAFLSTGNDTVNFYAAGNGGISQIEVGSPAGDPAELQVRRDLHVARGDNAKGELAIYPNAIVTVSNGWVYVSWSGGAQGTVRIAGGALDSFRGTVVINQDSSEGELILDSGSLNARAGLFFSRGTGATPAGSGIFRINGGIAEVGEITAENSAANNRIYLNGGTIRASFSNSHYLRGFTSAKLQQGGITFDIPEGIDITIEQSIQEDEASPNGAITKTGKGSLTLSGQNQISTPISIEEGLFIIPNAEALDSFSGYVLSEQGYISAPYTGGIPQLLAKIPLDSSGTLVITPANASEDIDFSNRPNMKLRMEGTFDYTGTFTPCEDQISLDVPSGTITLDRCFADKSPTEPTSLSITGGGNAKLILTGESTLTGNITIDSVKVELRTLTALGSAAPITLRNRAKLYFMQPQDMAAFSARLTAGSNGYLLMGCPESGQYDLNLSQLPDIVVGAAYMTNVLYTGVLTPGGNTYRLGGGEAFYASGIRGLEVNNLIDVNQQPTKTVLDGMGIVNLKSGNSYSGGTVISNNAVVFYNADGFGAVPSAVDPANIIIDQGVMRGGPNPVTLPATRGIQINEGGAIFHQWSSGTTTIRGNVHGTGPIKMTDTGRVVLSGDANDWSGKLTVEQGANFIFGDGTTFNINPAVEANINGLLSLNSDQDQIIQNNFTGSGILQKDGDGELTLTGNLGQWKTAVLKGTLHLGDSAVLSPGKGNISLAKNSTFEMDGRDLKIGMIEGSGNITNSDANPVSLTIGNGSWLAEFTGTIDPCISLIKVGTGCQRLSDLPRPISSLTIREGSISSLGENTIGQLHLQGGALGIGNIPGGLLGRYYKDVRPSRDTFGSLLAVKQFQDTHRPAMQVYSSDFGAFFDSGKDGERFPTEYNDNFIGVWKGYFEAETDGVYSFSICCDDYASVFIGDQLVIQNTNGYYNLSERDIMGEITLTKGSHPMTIAFGEVWGREVIQVYYKHPGSEAPELLPNSLLSACKQGGTTVNHITTDQGSLDFGSQSQSLLRITDPGDFLLDCDITGGNEKSELRKCGEGTMTLSAKGGDYSGKIVIEKGGIAIGNNTVPGILKLCHGTHAAIAPLETGTGRDGLVMKLYKNQETFNYDDFLTYEKITQLFAGLPPPNLTESSLILGANLDSGDSGKRFPGAFADDNFLTSLEGYILLDKDGTYTFGSNSDDGSVVYIDRQLVVKRAYDTGRNPGFEGTTGDVKLKAGFHEIFIGFRELGGDQVLQVSMKKPGESAFTRIPQDILFSGYTLLGGLEADAGTTVNLSGEKLILDQEYDTLFEGVFSGTENAEIEKRGTGKWLITQDNPDFHGGVLLKEGTIELTDNGTLGGGSISTRDQSVFSVQRGGALSIPHLSGNGKIRIDGGCQVSVGESTFEGTVEVIQGSFTLLSTKQALLSDQVGTVTGENLILSGPGKTIFTTPGNNLQVNTIRLENGMTGVIQELENIGNAEITLADGSLSTPKTVYPGSVALTDSMGSDSWQFNGDALPEMGKNGEAYFAVSKNKGSSAGSVFTKSLIQVSQPWYAKFRYAPVITVQPPADGFSFMIQTKASASVGGSGSCKGGAQEEINWQGQSKELITPAVAAAFNIYNGSTFAWTIDGKIQGSYANMAPINLCNGANIAITYNGTELHVIVEQGENRFERTLPISLTDKFGQENAYVGLTAGTGGCYAGHNIYGFSMANIAEPESTALSNTIVTIDEGKTGNISSDLPSTTLKGITFGAGSSLTFKPGEGATENADYEIDAGTIKPGANATLTVQQNGTGNGTLLLSQIDGTVSGTVTVKGGKIAAKDNTLTISVAQPVPKGVTYLLRFADGATWNGPLPTVVLKDTDGTVLNYPKVGISERGIYISTCTGTVMILQ